MIAQTANSNIMELGLSQTSKNFLSPKILRKKYVPREYKSITKEELEAVFDKFKHLKSNF